MNYLNIRRVKFQNLNEDGTEDGPPTYGIIASDSYAADFCNSFDSFERLNDSINYAENISKLIDDSLFDYPDIGTDNYYGPLISRLSHLN